MANPCWEGNKKEFIKCMPDHSELTLVICATGTWWSLLTMQHVWPHLICSVQLWAPQYRKDNDVLGWVWQRATKLGGAGALRLWIEAERTVSVQPGEEELKGRPYYCLQLLNGRVWIRECHALTRVASIVIRWRTTGTA